MQTLEIISINLWDILISLCNLLILYLILKKFLYKPVKKMLAARTAALNAQYEKASATEADALQLKAEWEEKMAGADAKANDILQRATENAQKRGDAIISESEDEAVRILRRAEADAEAERRKAEAGIRKEIVDVSAALSEKMLAREINAEDHRVLIDQFLAEIGDGDDRN